MRRRLALALPASLALAACGITPDKPARPTLYDFGPGAGALAPAAPVGLPLVLAEVEAGGALESTAMNYRLGYGDIHQLRPYALARWTAPPAQLVRQRLRDHLGRDRPVLDSGPAAALARRTDGRSHLLRVELEEFSQLFDNEKDSRGVIRLRCTLLETGSGGERLLAQRNFFGERPAQSGDASGGARALTAATDAVAQDVAAWVLRHR